MDAAAGVPGLVGVIVGAAFTLGATWLQRHKRHRSYWAAVSAEVGRSEGHPRLLRAGPLDEPRAGPSARRARQFGQRAAEGRDQTPPTEGAACLCGDR